MTIGDTAKFAINPKQHITNVEIMNVSTAGDRKLFTCRRRDNGVVILAFEEDLKPVTKMEKIK